MKAREKLYVIGAGPGGEAMLTLAAKDAIQRAKKIWNTRETPLAELVAALNDGDIVQTAVLVSGDSGFYSGAAWIAERCPAGYEVELIPGVSSVQYLSAKIKAPYDGAALVSLHGREGYIVAKAAYNKRLFVLAGGANNAQRICHTLSSRGLGNVRVTVGERLSFPEERIVSGSADELQALSFDGLSVLYIENPNAADPHMPLRDADFTRGGVPMTKEEVRWIALQKLGVSPRDVVFDVGAGTGAVSVELARKAHDGFVYAIESKEEACALVLENATRHGAFNLEIVHGEAPEAFAGLPVPDKAFIGGSSGNMEGILERLLSLNAGIRVVATAVTLQTINRMVTAYERFGMQDMDVICVNIAKSKKAGRYDMMVAQNPVYVITGTGGGARRGRSAGAESDAKGKSDAWAGSAVGAKCDAGVLDDAGEKDGAEAKGATGTGHGFGAAEATTLGGGDSG